MSEFHRVLLGLHSQARRVDRDHALLGALGVGAFAYPHQLDSVHRMITGTECRWLLADEVGLCKTIQAIMVMRALATQSRGRCASRSSSPTNSSRNGKKNCCAAAMS